MLYNLREINKAEQTKKAETLAEKMGLQQATAQVLNWLDGGSLPANETEYKKPFRGLRCGVGDFWTIGAEFEGGAIVNKSQSVSYNEAYTLKTGEIIKESFIYNNGVAVVFENPTTKKQRIFIINER
jgi:hypothetical protein